MADSRLPSPRRLPTRSEVESCVPTAAVWEITLACNLHCKLCGSRAGKARRDELSTAEAFDLVDQLAAMGVRDVGLIGGEVHLRKDWIEIVAAIVRAGMTCSIQTGGRSFSATVAARAAAAGLSGAGVSIDGLRENHDLIRGFKGSFDQAIAALGHLRDNGLSSSVSTQLWSKSIGDLRGLLGVIAAAGAKSWQLQLSVAMGNASDNNSYLLQPYQMVDVFPLLNELYDEASALGVRLIVANNVGYFGPYEAKLRSVEPFATHWDGCSAGRNGLGIEADGKIKGCPSLATADFTGANIRDMPLDAIWHSTQQLAYMRTRTREDLWGFCRSCYYADVCVGGCTWTAHSLFGRPGNNPYCHHRALSLKKDGLRERINLVQRAPGVSFDNGIFELIVEDAEGRVASRTHPAGSGFSSEGSLSKPVRKTTDLLLCSACDQFALPEETVCPFCGTASLETSEQRQQNLAGILPALQQVRAALAAVPNPPADQDIRQAWPVHSARHQKPASVDKIISAT
jgi:radical SAM protein with 4Fe4S-binding SPASM domain